MKKYLRIKEAGEYIGVCPDTLRNWESKGLITPKRLGSRKDRVYSTEQLDELFNTTNNEETNEDNN